ncbi:alpha-amylase family glycosyl hydrolase [Microbacterium pumilum]|uniref:Alpha-amylase family protein n=1 Tax=Microbacterium pumilum TaxID=344165 RepID=A0ABN2RRN1_9MICO
MHEGSSPAWVDNAIWWHVYPLGFLGADPTGVIRKPGRTVAAIEPWLDYVLDLGLNGIVLAPIFESETHGYDTTDYFQIDTRLGTEADLVSLVAAARGRGIRVLLDGVFNHVGRSFRSPAPTDGDLLERTSTGEVVTFEGHEGLVVLNHDDERVADLVVEAMAYWLDRGIDGWRLDAAYAVPPAFWARVLPRVRERHPDAYFMGEYLQADYTEVVREGRLDSATQYELWQAIWHSIEDENFFELDWALTRHNGFLETFVPYTFIGNHDVTRIASQITDARHHPHALVLLLVLGGTPSIYYGDERGLRAVKETRWGGDDEIRPVYPDDPADFAAGGETFRLHQELIGLRRRNPWLVRATTSAVICTNTQYVIEVVADEGRLFVALNLSDEALPARIAQADLVAGHATETAGGWQVASHGWAVWQETPGERD